MIPVVLREWEYSAPLPINKDDIPALRKRLRNLADVVYDLDGVKLRARSHVGFIPVDEELQLVVMPKIENFDDFFYVLEQAGVTPEYRRWMDESVLAGLDESQRQNAPEFLIRMLLYKLRLLKRDGFYRKALPRSETRTSVKGKIQLTNTVRQCLVRGKLHQVHCAYFDPTVDTVENRFIKYTVWRLIHTKLPRDLKRDLHRFWRIFASIPFNPTERYLREIEYIIRRRRLPSSRSYYVDILSLCFLIIENSTVVVKEGEDIRLSAFAISMDRMFEKYIRNILSEALHPDFSVLDGNREQRKLFADSDEPSITPDIMVYDALNCLVVADAKYKEKDLPSADDWYQAIAYALALDVPTGVLIYSTNAPRRPQKFRIGDKTMWVYYFPLQQPKEQEAALVQFFHQRAEEAMATPGEK
jgi:5-methylcytosine-specific restriction endonuclease McrBC regulatory subunit McrC